MSQDSYDPRRFQTTVPFYARYRLGYPDLLIQRVIERVGIAPGDAVMDLGCGPGLLAIPFAKAGMKVTAVDPEPDMLEAAHTAAPEAGVSINFWQFSSFAPPTCGEVGERSDPGGGPLQISCTVPHPKFAKANFDLPTRRR